MKKRSSKNIQKKPKAPQSKQTEDELSSRLVGKFKESVRSHLSKLIQKGLDPSKASNVIIYRLLSPTSKMDMQGNFDDIQSIQMSSGISVEEAFYAFLIKREIAQHKQLGFNTSDAISELVKRLGNFDEKEDFKAIPKRKRVEDEIEGHVKKPKTAEEPGLQEDSKELFFDREIEIKRPFEAFKRRFQNNAARKNYFLKNKLGFVNQHECDMPYNEVEDEEDSDRSSEDSAPKSYFNIRWPGNADRGREIFRNNVLVPNLRREVDLRNDIISFRADGSELNYLRRDPLNYEEARDILEPLEMRLQRIYQHEIDSEMMSSESDSGEGFGFPSYY